jgi:tRNA threonylcarbamoyl adenosine modification protein YjeE
MLVDLPEESAVAGLARRIAVHVRRGDRIALDGPMGAGKTTFVRHLVAALGGDATCVASPTYTLLHRYESDPPVIHVDACRLTSPGQLTALGFDELCEDAVAAVEWAAQVEAVLQPDWRIAFDHAAVGRCATVQPPAGIRL